MLGNATCILLGFGMPSIIQTVFVNPNQPFSFDGKSNPLTVVVAIFLGATAVCCGRLSKGACYVFVSSFVALLATTVVLMEKKICFSF